MTKEKTLDDLRETLHDQLKADALAGDTTVLFELLDFVPVQNLVGALSNDNEVEKFEHLIGTS